MKKPLAQLQRLRRSRDNHKEIAQANAMQYGIVVTSVSSDLIMQIADPPRDGRLTGVQ